MVKSPSVEPVVRSRLLPRISFRMMFVITTLAAILAALARWAGNGNEFAIGMITAFGFVMACFLSFVLLFFVGWATVVHRDASRVVAIAIGSFMVGGASYIGPSEVISITLLIAGIFCFVVGVSLYVVRGPDDAPVPTSPFAADKLPPQILPPREPTQ